MSSTIQNPFAPKTATPTPFGYAPAQSAPVDPNQQYVQYLDSQFSLLAKQVNVVREVFGKILSRHITTSEIFALQLAQYQLEVIAADFRSNVTKARHHPALANMANAAAAGYRHQIIPLFEQVAHATMQLIQNNESVEQGLNSAQKDALQPGAAAVWALYVQYGKAAGQVGMQLSERLHNLRMEAL